MTTYNGRQFEYGNAGRLDRVAFWTSLPAHGELDSTARGYLRDSDNDIARGRYESALDRSLAVNAHANDYIPGFVRTAELLVATNRIHRARRLVNTILQHESLIERNEFELELAKLLIHTDPEPKSARTIAEAIIDSGSKRLFEPYVPASIEILTASGEAQVARDLAKRWHDTAPDAPGSNAYYIRELLRSGDHQSAAETLKSFREQNDAERNWPGVSVVSALLPVITPNGSPNWMVLGPVCEQVRARRLDQRQASDVLEFFGPVIQSSSTPQYIRALIAFNAGERRLAGEIVSTTRPETPQEQFIGSIISIRSAQYLKDRESRRQLLFDAFKATQNGRAREIANRSTIFDPPATFKEIGLELASMLQEDESYKDALAVLDRIVQAGESGAEVERLRAVIMGQTGSKQDALKELDKVLNQQEANRQFKEAAETLRSMIRLLPGNLRLRDRLVDTQLKTGDFDGAIEQLVLQAKLLHRAGRNSETNAPIHRALDIATMTSRWDVVEKLHKLMISFAPDDTGIRHAAVATYVQYGRIDAALDQLREIAKIAKKQKDPDEAIAAYHQMLALAPDEPSTYHHLGELLVSIGEYGQAERVYKRLSVLTPDEPAVRAKLSAISALARSRSKHR
jgi:tetratricopeptide (TPR) repeat protein